MEAEKPKDFLEDFEIITEGFDKFFVTAMLGDPKVGKTSILQRMFDGTFSEDYVKTDDVINEKIYFLKEVKKKSR